MTGCPTCPETEHECRNWDWSGHCAECGEKTLPEWERELLARQEQAAQPDRPAPVDPSEVRVGDVVEVEGEDWMVRGPVTDTDADQPYPISVVVPSVGGAVIWPHMRQATVRILRRAAPEPDPEKVRAWTQWLADHGAGRNGVAETLVRAGLEVPDA